MKKKIAALSFCMGLLFFCFYHNWILFAFPFTKTSQVIPTAQKKEIPLYFVKNGSWHKETSTILWRNSTPQVMHELLNRWFLIGDDEELLPHKVTVVHCALSQNKTTLFVTIDRSPFSHNNSLHEKIMILEGLLKTIRENNSKISYLYILINGKPLEDQHICFLNPLTISGFSVIES